MNLETLSQDLLEARKKAPPCPLEKLWVLYNS